MFSDSTIEYLTHDDLILTVVLFLFFLPEMAMMYELPLIYYWIPLVSVLVRLGIPSLVPESIHSTLFHFLVLMADVFLGYGTLFFVAMYNFWVWIWPLVFLSILLIIQFTGLLPDYRNRVVERMDRRFKIWRECTFIEAKKNGTK